MKQGAERNVLVKVKEHDIPIVAVHPYGKVFLLFTTEGIYACGEPKEVVKIKF